MLDSISNDPLTATLRDSSLESFTATDDDIKIIEHSTSHALSHFILLTTQEVGLFLALFYRRENSP